MKENGCNKIDVECERRFSILETKFDNINNSLGRIESLVKDGFYKTDNFFDKHNERIKSLETWQTWLFGAWAIIGAFAYGLWDFFKTR